VRVDFGGVCIFQAANVASKFYDGHLKAETQAEIRQIVFAGVFYTSDFSFGTACSETARYDNSANVRKLLGDVVVGDVRCFNPFDIDFCSESYAGVFESVYY